MASSTWLTRVVPIAAFSIASLLGAHLRVARADPPPAAAAVAAAGIERFVLPNGLEVILAEDHAVREVALEMRWKVGTRDDPPGRRGMAELVGVLLTKGATRHLGDAWRLQVCAALRCGPIEEFISRTVAVDHTMVRARAAPGELELLLWLESDRFGFWTDGADAHAIAAARATVIRAAAERADSPDVVENTALERAYGPAHPLGRAPGSGAGELAGLSVAALRARAATHYGPSNAILTLAGDFSASRARELVTRYFGSIAGGPPPPPAAPPAPPPRLDAEIRLVFDAAVDRPRAVALWPTAAWFQPDDLALDVLARVLERRLRKRLVDEERIASFVDVRQASTPVGSYFRVALAAAGAHGADELLARLDQELDELRRTAPPAAEVAQAVARQIGDHLLSNEGSAGRASDLAAYAHVVGDPGYEPRYLAGYRAVGAEQVRAVASTQLPRGRRVVAVVLPNPTGPKGGRLTSEERR
jgi:predicted Zn-dependent peptidase